MQQLQDRVAVVTGASRGAGRAIAVELGEQGATVYVTGRSVRGGPVTENLPGTVDETAEEVSARGGTGIVVRCDSGVLAKSGRILTVGDLARECGSHDVDGRQPEASRISESS